jgi:acetyl esterase
MRYEITVEDVEAAMEEGCPARALEQGEKVQLPPVLYLQGTEDVAHPRPHLDRFVAAYRKAGGLVDLELFDGEGQGFIMRKAGPRPPTAPSTSSSSSCTSRSGSRPSAGVVDAR